MHMKISSIGWACFVWSCVVLSGCGGSPAGTTEGTGGESTGNPGGAGGAAGAGGIGGQGGSGNAGGGQPSADPIVDVDIVADDSVGHMCLVRKSGALCCWGTNTSGQLGDGTTSPSDNAVPVSGISDAVAVTVGDLYSCALRKDGSVSCWGDNLYGRLGTGDSANHPSPAPVVGLSAKATAIHSGFLHTFAQLETLELTVWGHGAEGVFGNGPEPDSSSAVLVQHSANDLTDILDITGCSTTACALSPQGEVYCWGRNAYGLLGRDQPDFDYMDKASSVLSDVKDVSSQCYSACAVRKDGSVWCWGDGVTAPVQIPGVMDAVQVTAGQRMCALLAGGTVSCWTSVMAPQPEPFTALGSDVERLFEGDRNSKCALKKDGRVVCWGELPTGGGKTKMSADPVELTDTFVCNGDIPPPL
jgi:alpha-tubulin suppressor-like RCC1 family protein